MWIWSVLDFLDWSPFTITYIFLVAPLVNLTSYPPIGEPSENGTNKSDKLVPTAIGDLLVVEKETAAKSAEPLYVISNSI